jgi:hypothetical protein
LLEDKQSAAFLWIKTGGLDDAHHRILVTVAIDIAGLELIYRVGQTPTVKPVETVMLFPQFEGLGFAMRAE